MEPMVQSGPALTPFGKYLLDEEIARGGMARVYLARLRGLGGFEKTLVVKQVLPELASDPRFVEMFVEEAKTLVQMSHPHIVPVYELGIVDGIYFLAMEHVEGATLADVLDAGPLRPPLSAHLGVQVCDALQYAHVRHRLVHRDVTPRNVIIDSLGHVRLLDFGIAAKADVLEGGEVFGSHGYMSPEQARGEVVDPKSDLFSLGAVLYEALTGEPAFLMPRVEDTRAALLEGEPPRLSGREDVPEALATIVDELMESAPAHRPESAARVGQRLRGWLAGAEPEGVAPELGARVHRSRARRKQTPSTRPPGDTARRDPSGFSRSIATSVTLQQILKEHDPEARPPTDEEGIAEPVTTPLEGRTQPHGEPDAAQSQAGTVPIEGRRSHAPAETGAESKDRPEPGGVEPQAVARPARGRRLLPLVAALTVGVVATLGVRALVMEEPRGTDDPAERSAREQPDPPGAAGDRAPETGPAKAEGGGKVTPRSPGEGTDPETRPPAGQGERGGDPQAVPRARAYLDFGANGNAELYVDGERRATEPRRRIAIAPGRHVIEVRNPAMGTHARQEIEAVTGRRLTIQARVMGDPLTFTVQ